MNATTTAILETITASDPDITARSLIAVVGKSETTVRKALKELEAANLITSYVDSDSDNVKHYSAVIEEPAVEEPTTEDEAPAKKRYTRHQKPTTRTVRVNQITKAEVQVIRGDEEPKGGLDLNGTEYAGEKWATVCITDGQAAGFDLVLDAHYASSYPEFCTVCAPKLEGKVGRRRAAATQA